jgi:16S rRNA (uracil1498-N3)-methyltransferase
VPARLFVDVDPAAPDEARVDGAAVKHLRALRLGPGSEVVAIVGPGSERRASVVALGRGGATLRLGERLPDSGADPRAPLVLAIALADLARIDLVIEKATELGATAVWPFLAERSQVRHVAPSRRERWSRIARAACEQCGRTVPPEIDPPLSLEELCARIERRAAVLLQPGSPQTAAPPADEEGRVVIVGPEGGLTGAEVERLRRRGARLSSLGPRVLRFETAAIAALVWASVGGR